MIPELQPSSNSFCKPACVKKQRDLVFSENLFYVTYISHGDRLSASGIIGDCQHANRNVLRPFLLDKTLQRLDVHVSFEVGDDGRKCRVVRDYWIDGTHFIETEPKIFIMPEVLDLLVCQINEGPAQPDTVCVKTEDGQVLWKRGGMKP